MLFLRKKLLNIIFYSYYFYLIIMKAFLNKFVNYFLFLIFKEIKKNILNLKNKNKFIRTILDEIDSRWALSSILPIKWKRNAKAKFC